MAVTVALTLLISGCSVVQVKGWFATHGLDPIDTATARVIADRINATEPAGCDENYEGSCIPRNQTYVRCAGDPGRGPEVSGAFKVAGWDHFGLDRNKDGVACSAGDTPALLMANIVNLWRTLGGVPPVSLCAPLMRAAQTQSNSQAARTLRSHTGPDGSRPSERGTRAGYDWLSYGENVASHYRDVYDVMDAWMASTGHRANIMSTQFQHMGMGWAVGADGATYWTLDFAGGGTC